MKKIIFNLTILVFLSQNSFGEDWFAKSLNCLDEVEKNKSANVDSCLSVIKSIEKKDKLNKMENKILIQMYLNAGVIYYYTNNKVNAFKYWMNTIKKGNSIDPIASKSAQKNLDILCKESSWVCK